MKKGQVVRCVSVSNNVNYLTEGELYTITAGQGDPDMFGDCVRSSTSFEIVNDFGRKIFARYPECAHAKWELVSK